MSRAKFLLLLAVLVACSLPFTPALAQDGKFNVSILYTGDTQGHLKSFPYGSSKSVGGVAKRAIFFQEKRRHKSMAWLTLDAGDAISGTALSNTFKGTLDVEAMNRLNYDAMVLGVHEFDYGVDTLKQRIAEAKFPVLSANIVYADTGQPFATPYVILDRNGVKIAILGLTTGELKQRVATDNFAGLNVVDPIETARQIIPQLQAQSDMIVALTHLGINEDIRLASQVPGIDVVVGGMSHSELQVPMKVGETLIVHDAVFGAHVGLLKLSFARSVNGDFQRVYFDCQLEPMEGKWVENSNYVDWLASYSQELSERMALIVGSSSATMSDLKTRSSETELGNYIGDLIRQKAGADAALLPAAFFQSSMPSGALTLGDLYKVMPYDHYAVVLPVTGGELKEILDDAAGQIGKPGFPQVSGLKFGIFNGKAYQIEVDGSPLDPFGSYRLVTSDFLADGGLGYAALGTIDNRLDTGRLIRDLVVEQLSSGQAASSSVYGRIFFLAQEPQGQPQPAHSAQQPPATTPPADAGSMPEGTGSNIEDDIVEELEDIEDSPRLDREGEPMEDEPLVIEDEVIGEGGEIMDEADEVIEETETVVEEIASSGEEDFDPSDVLPDRETEGVPSGNVLGQARETIDGIEYTFTVVEPTPGDLMFHLRMLNVTNLPIELSYPTGERFNFLVFDGNSTIWSYNFNRFFMQALENATLGPGKEINHQTTEAWSATTSDGTPLPAKTYRFEARHTSTGNSAVISFEAALGN